MEDEQQLSTIVVPDTIMPPNNKKAEVAVLGSALLENKAFLDVADLLEADDFYDPRHKTIFSFMVDLWHNNSPIDIVTLSNKLYEKNKIEEVGGSAYLTEITESIPSAANILHYANIVHKKSILRQLGQASYSIGQLSRQEDRDTDLLLDDAEKTIFKIAEQGTIKNFATIDDQSLEDAFNRIEKLSKDRNAIRGIPTGFSELDQILSGFQKSDLIILAARPSLGKSSLAIDIARNASLNSKASVAIFSLEMGKDQITDRLIAAQSKVDLWKIRTGRRLQDQDFSKIRDAMGVISGAPIYVDDNLTAGIMQMRAMARRLQADKGLDLLIIDYLQLIQPRKDSDNIVAQVSEVSRGLKSLARELNIPVLALSQLSRAVEQRGGKPKLSDLRDSGSIEQDADVVLFISRDTSNQEDPMAGMEAQIIVAKHRNGPIGNVNLLFNKQYASFSSVDIYHQEPGDIQQQNKQQNTYNYEQSPMNEPSQQDIQQADTPSQEQDDFDMDNIPY